MSELVVKILPDLEPPQLRVEPPIDEKELTVLNNILGPCYDIQLDDPDSSARLDQDSPSADKDSVIVFDDSPESDDDRIRLMQVAQTIGSTLMSERELTSYSMPYLPRGCEDALLWK